MEVAPLATARQPAAISPPGRARKLRRGPLTRKQILDAALKLFSDRGFARTSVRDIAQAAGITDAAIYYHFASKRDLFEALIEERGFTTALENLEKAEITIGPREAIPLLALNSLQFIFQNRDLMKVLLVEAMAQDAVAAEEYRVLVERWERALARILRIYAERHQLVIQEVEELSKQLVVTVLGAFSDYLMAPDPPGPNGAVPPRLRRNVEVAMRNIVQGIVAPDT
jgi:AcrR family transcriptional regulator